MKIIGLTGGTGAGKTTAAKIFQENGFYIVDADELSRKVTSPASPCVLRLAEQFGKEILNSDLSLNREMLAKLAFENEENTSILNHITHPFILKEIMELVKNAQTQYSFVVIDAPLLFESGLNSLCDIIIAMTAPPNLRVDRLQKRDNVSEDLIHLRIARQKNQVNYYKNADFVVDNSDTIEILTKKLCTIIHIIQSS